MASILQAPAVIRAVEPQSKKLRPLDLKEHCSDSKGPEVVPFYGSYKVIPKRNYLGAYGYCPPNPEASFGMPSSSEKNPPGYSANSPDCCKVNGPMFSTLVWSLVGFRVEGFIGVLRFRVSGFRVSGLGVLGVYGLRGLGVRVSVGSLFSLGFRASLCVNLLMVDVTLPQCGFALSTFWNLGKSLNRVPVLAPQYSTAPLENNTRKGARV